MTNHDMPLAMARPGEMVTVAGVRAGLELQRRLADMGLTPGVQIRVMNGQGPGPVLIDLKGSRVALGRGVAQKIMVTESENGKGNNYCPGGQSQFGQDHGV
ncbi:ferrous iron transport protein A [Dehalococcoidia bacterium]|nr:ferrous iron transport protein A [Dehalococcoidia bacterium]MCL0049457.1 ferrous iron transport protein A [Dehalococcoidia bacterium]MCL0080543.1 ferrous iron transport protein A [Dehalococcoidia bacterium]